MKLTKTLASVIVWALFALIVALTTLLIVSHTLKSSEYDSVGVRVVKAMYEFDSPAELSANQSVVIDLLCQEEWERLRLDNERRAINAYFKFGYSKSEVRVVSYTNGYVLYSLVNENIDSEDLWVFMYDIDSDGKLCNIREYSLIAEGRSYND